MLPIAVALASSLFYSPSASAALTDQQCLNKNTVYRGYVLTTPPPTSDFQFGWDFDGCYWQTQLPWLEQSSGNFEAPYRAIRASDSFDGVPSNDPDALPLPEESVDPTPEPIDGPVAPSSYTDWLEYIGGAGSATFTNSSGTEVIDVVSINMNTLVAGSDPGSRVSCSGYRSLAESQYPELIQQGYSAAWCGSYSATDNNFAVLRKNRDPALLCQSGYELVQYDGFARCESIFEIYPPSTGSGVKPPPPGYDFDPDIDNPPSNGGDGSFEPGDRPDYDGSTPGTPDGDGGWNFDFSALTGPLADVVSNIKGLGNQLFGVNSRLDTISGQLDDIGNGGTDGGGSGDSDNECLNDLEGCLTEDVDTVDDWFSERSSSLDSELDAVSQSQADLDTKFDEILSGASEIGSGTDSTILQSVIDFVPQLPAPECSTLVYFQSTPYAFDIPCTHLETMRSWFGWILSVIVAFAIILLFFRTDGQPTT